MPLVSNLQFHKLFIADRERFNCVARERYWRRSIRSISMEVGRPPRERALSMTFPDRLISNSHGWISLARLKWRFKWQFIQFLSRGDVAWHVWNVCNKFCARNAFDCLKVHSASSAKVQASKVYGFEGDCGCCVIVTRDFTTGSFVTHPANVPALQNCKFRSPISVCLGFK